MNYESVCDLKQEILHTIDTTLRFGKDGATSQALVRQPVEKRIAVGYSQVAEGEFRLELRIQRRDQWAYRFAEAQVERTHGEVNFEVIPRIEVPSRHAARSQGNCMPIVNLSDGRLHIGLSIGPNDGGTGTLGAFLSRKDGNYILSCSHVMVAGGSPVISSETVSGDPIFHPGREMGVRLDATRQIAQLSNYVLLSSQVENDIDCAIARLGDRWDYDTTRVPLNLTYPNEGRIITPMADPHLNLQRDMVVCKIGRTTCFTQGLVRAVGLDRLPVFVPDRGNVFFSDVIEIRSTQANQPFSLPGDSGALVYTDNGLEAVGLVFAGGEREDGYKVSFVCNLDPILKWAEADLLH